MRPALPFALPLIALSFLSASPASALDMPPRKPGLWELKMTFEGRKLPPQVFQHCIDAATDKQMNTIGNARAGQCEKQDVQRSGDTIVVDSVCKIGPTTTTSHGVVTGSFDSAYTVNVTSKREGGPAIPNMPAESHMLIEAKWTGPCKADQKPGDMIMANGMKLNIHDMPNVGALKR